MSSKYFYKLGIGILSVLMILALVSFSQEDSTEVDIQPKKVIPELVQQKLKEKLDKFRDIIIEKCKKKAIDDAEVFVDSLVSEELKLIAGDSLFFPAKPVRPGLPEKIILNDSTIIDPIF